MEDINLSPWLGLMSYEEKDAHLFYGRSEELKELYEDIFHNPQTVIYGPSGTGKTSIIKAGIFSLARKDNLLPVYIRLNHESSESYATQIIQKVRNALTEIEGEIENLIEPICDKECSLWEFFHSNEFWNKENYPLTPLIIIDQFEEIFTLTKDKTAINNFFVQFSDLCDNKMPKSIQEYLNTNSVRREYPDKINYRIVLSLREDFLARLEEFSVNIPSLRRNRFSLQAINEEQAMEIIMKPSKGMVKEDVAIKIIQKVTNKSDIKLDGIPKIKVETALLSLFCNELNKKRIIQGYSAITSDLVEASGDNIIKEFYEKTMALVSEKTMLYLENALLTKKGFRDSIALADALDCGVTRDEIDCLQQNRLIHVDEWDGTKRVEFTHDVLCKVATQKRDEREAQLKLQKITEEQKIQKKKYRRLELITFTILIFLVVGGYEVYDKFLALHEDYYAIIVKRNGFMEGRKPLSKDEASHLSCYFKLSRKGLYNSFKDFMLGNLKPYNKMYAMDGYGKLSNKNNVGTYLISKFDDEDFSGVEKNKDRLKGACQWESIPDDKGQIACEKAFDKNNKLIYSFIYTARTDNGNTKQVVCQYSDEYGLPFKQRKNGGDYIRITYDKNGYEALYEFFDSDGNSRPNKDGAYAQRSGYNKDGLTTYFASLDEKGHLMIDNAGNTGMRAEYDKFCNQVKATSFGSDGKIHKVKYGYAIITYTYDKWGHQLTASYFDEKGKPCIDNKNNCHGVFQEYNQHGDRIAISFVGLNNKPCVTTGGYAKFVDTYDKNGNVTEERYFDISGKLCINNSGYAIYSAKYDDDSNRIQTAFYDTNNKPQTTEYGYAKFITKFDAQGNVMEESYFGADNKPCIDNEGYAKFTNKLDNHRNIIERKYFDIYGRPCLCKEGYARYTANHNKRGNIIQQKFYGIDGKLCLCKEGYAKAMVRYDEHQNAIENIYFDVNGSLTCVNGYARFTSKYDDQGNKVEEEYFDNNGKSCIIKDYGYARLISKYNRQGHKIKEENWGINAKLCINKSGYAKSVIKYDDYDNIIEQAYFGLDGKPCIQNEGYAKYTNKFNERNEIIETRYYGLDGKLCMSNSNYSIYKAKYNASGKKIEASFYDIYGKPCIISGGYAKYTYKYDLFGNIIETRYYNINGKPCQGDEKWAICKTKYDAFRNKTEQAYYGIDSKPCLTNGGYAKYKQKYDQHGNIIEEKNYGINGKLCMNNYNCAIYKAKYNASGKLVQASFYGTDGKPCLTDFANGGAKKTFKYDISGNLIETRYYGIDGKPCTNNDGYSVETSKYDKRRNLISNAFFDIKGNQLSNAKTVTAEVLEGGIASQNGMNGVYYVISYGDYEFGDDYSNITSSIKKYKEKKKKLVVMDGQGRVSTFKFDPGLIGINFKSTPIDLKIFNRIKQIIKESGKELL